MPSGGSGRAKPTPESFLEEMTFLLGFEERDDLGFGKIILSIFQLFLLPVLIFKCV